MSFNNKCNTQPEKNDFFADFETFFADFESLFCKFWDKKDLFPSMFGSINNGVPVLATNLIFPQKHRKNTDEMVLF